jgi:hypothetical protein
VFNLRAKTVCFACLLLSPFPMMHASDQSTVQSTFDDAVSTADMTGAPTPSPGVYFEGLTLLHDAEIGDTLTLLRSFKIVLLLLNFVRVPPRILL